MKKLSVATVSREQFVQQLGESGLASGDDLQVLLRPFSHIPDGVELAKSLVDAGKLTEYQASALLERRLDELRIGGYEILDRLGAGGMGTVFKARHRRMKRIVAIKVLSRDVSRPESFVQRFQREVETIAQLNHPNIVMAYDAGEDEIGHFLVMEFIEGRDLASEVQRSGPFSALQAIETILQAARGLEYAHSKGIIHRDVKPANLLKDRSGVVKVADLGLARLYAPGSSEGISSITQSGGIVGTVDFMSPEQAFDSTTIDHRADIYSLGGTLYYLLIGQPPYVAPSLMGLLLKHSAADVPLLRTIRPDVPAELEAIYLRMMAKSPDDRYASLLDVIHDLEAARPLAARAVRPSEMILPLAETETDLPGVTLHVPRSERKQAKPPEGPATIIERPKPKSGPHRHLAAESSSGPGNPAALTVVLAEPSRAQASIIRGYLQQIGVKNIHHVTSGQEATQLVRVHRPQVVFSALHLSDMTGVQLAKMLLNESVGFVLITSEANAQDASNLPQQSRSVVMYKPFDLQRLAQALAQAVGQEIPGLPSHRPTENLQVLLVDDSSTARAHMRAVLRGIGFDHFTEAKDGATAVELLQSRHFDLVVMDYEMPGLNGLDVTRFIRQQSTTPRVPILLVTTETDPSILDTLRREGVSAICEKSFKPDAVREVLTRLLKDGAS